MTAPMEPVGAGGVPRSVARRLLPYERLVRVVRFHPVVLAGPAAAAVAAVGIGAWAGGRVQAVWLGVMGVLAWAGWRVTRWATRYLVLTSQRILITEVLPFSEVSMIPIVSVASLTYRQDALGQLLGYGEFLTLNAGAPASAFRRVRFVPHAEQLYMEICGMIFPE